MAWQRTRVGHKSSNMSTTEAKVFGESKECGGEKKKLKVFIISGKASGGKDYHRAVIFNILKAAGKTPLAISFADHFKVDCVAKDGLEYSKVFGEKRDAITRKILQKRGSEEGLDVYGPRIWCNTTHTWMLVQSERGVDYFIVADGRFGHEIDWGYELDAKIIRLEAPRRTWRRMMKEAGGDEELAKSLASHRSETALDDPKWREKFHLIVNNDDGQELESVRIITEFVKKELAKE